MTPNKFTLIFGNKISKNSLLAGGAVAITTLILFSCHKDAPLTNSGGGVIQQRGTPITLLNKDRTPNNALLAVEGQANYDMGHLPFEPNATKDLINQSIFTLSIPSTNGIVSAQDQKNALNSINQKTDQLLIDLYGKIKRQLANIAIIDIEPVIGTSDWVVNVISSLPDGVTQTEGATCYCELDNTKEGNESNFKFPGYPINQNHSCIFANNNMTASLNNAFCVSPPIEVPPGNIRNDIKEVAKYYHNIQAIHTGGLNSKISLVDLKELPQNDGTYSLYTDEYITLPKQRFIFDDLRNKTKNLISSRGNNAAILIAINADSREPAPGKIIYIASI